MRDSMTRMGHDLVRPPKARRGERIAVLSPSFAAAGAFPAVHEQAMRRLTEVTGLIPGGVPDDADGGSAANGTRRRCQCRLRGSGHPRHPGGDVLDGGALIIETS